MCSSVHRTPPATGVCHQPRQSTVAQQCVKTRTTASHRPYCLSSRTSSDPHTFSNIRGDERSPAVTKLPSITSGETGRIQQWLRYPLWHQWRPAESQVPPTMPGEHSREFPKCQDTYTVLWENRSEIVTFYQNWQFVCFTLRIISNWPWHTGLSEFFSTL